MPQPRIMTRIQSSLAGITPDVTRKHLLLGVATFGSMVLTYYSNSYYNTVFDKLLGSVLYSGSLVIILLSHEFGHYINAREYGVVTTLPYFIPLPFLSPFGTLGAFIRMKSLPPDRRALFDISYWGPAMSFYTSIPAVIIGLLLSTKVPVDLGNSGVLIGSNPVVFGTSLLMDFLIKIFANVPDGYTLVLHPVAFAGWVGLFVTAINLFPIGQLDGGHIAYVFLGKRQIYIAYIFLGVLGYLTLFVSPGWTFWIFMLLMMGLRHPPIRTTENMGLLPHRLQMDKKRLFRGILSVLIFIICFIPEPIKVTRPPARTNSTPPAEREMRQDPFELHHEINFQIPPHGVNLWK